jgi:FkbM family methyltransferase
VPVLFAKMTRLMQHLEYCGELWRCFSVFRAPARMIAGYLGLPVSYPFTCETVGGTKIRVASRADLATAWIIYLRREYMVDPGDEVVVDCGANIGVFSLYAASCAPRSRIFAVEPFPSTFQELRDNIALNRLDRRVNCLAVALSETDGSVNMYAATHVPSQAREVIRPSLPDTISVPAMSLSSLLKTINVPVIDLLKMDIEGSEHAVFLNTRPSVLTCVKRISIEYHRTAPKQPLFEFLNQAGFVLQRDRVLGRDYGVAEFVSEAP